MAEEEEMLDDELQQMFVESERAKVLDSHTFSQPVHFLKRIDPICLEEGATVQQAMETMIAKKIGCMLITRKRKLTGILTEGDVARKIVGAKKDATKILVENFMTKDPESFEPGVTIAYVLNAMVVGGYRHIPLVNGKHEPIAVISVNDIVRHLVSFFSEEVLNLPPKPMNTTKDREGA